MRLPLSRLEVCERSRASRSMKGSAGGADDEVSDEIRNFRTPQAWSRANGYRDSQFALRLLMGGKDARHRGKHDSRGAETMTSRVLYRRQTLYDAALTPYCRSKRFTNHRTDGRYIGRPRAADLDRGISPAS